MSASTGYYLVGHSWLHRRHPLTKLLGLGVVLLAAFLLPNVALVPMAVGCVVVAVSAGLLGPVLRSLRVPVLLLASILVVNALFFPGATDRLVVVGPFAITREGLGFGLVTAGRLLVVFLASVLFLFTTLADDLLEALVARGVSHRLAFVVLSAVQLVPRMQARATTILEAQQARGLVVGGSPWRRLRALVPLIGPVVLGSLIDVQERTFALEARGFGARPGRTAYRVVVDPPIDRWLRWSLVVAALVIVVSAVVATVARPIA
jgi:energy-coupling factor transport system permease protein